MRGVKTKWENRWKKLAVFVLLILIFGVLINSVTKVYKKKREAERALAQMEEELMKLDERDKLLKESLARLSTEEGLEFEIRKKLNVAEAGESVAIIVEEEQGAPDAGEDKSAWQKVKEFFDELFN